MRSFFVSSAAATVLLGCASAKTAGPPPIEVKSTGVQGEAAGTLRHKMTATVLAVDAAGGKLTVQAQDRRAETIVVPKDLKDLDGFAPGDTIETEVEQGLLLQFQPVGSKFVAPAGDLPDDSDAKSRTLAGGSVRSTVTVTGVDRDRRIVRFQDPYGDRYEVKVAPDLPIEIVARGDRLLATYVVKVAISLERKAK
jgi:hypothetical protein